MNQRPIFENYAVQETSKASIRLFELDGLRGWAALSVVVFHIAWETLGLKFPLIRNPVTAGLINGHLDVAIFFVVSGAALSAPFYTGGGTAYLLSATLRRYLRLAIPIFGATLVLWGLSQLHLVHNQYLAVMIDRRDWGFLKASAYFDFATIFQFSLVQVFSGGDTQTVLMPQLWTMPIEMIGSMLLFLLLACRDEFADPRRSMLIIAGLVFFLFPFIAAFFFGAALCEARYSGALQKLWAAIGLIPKLCIAVGLYGLASLTQYLDIHIGDVINVAIAVCIVAIVLSSKFCQKIFGLSRLSRFLGRLSFPLYLLHYIVIVTLMPLMLLYAAVLSPISAALIAGTTVIVSIAAAVVFAPVEQYAHVCSRWFAKSLR
jgi:peptidoglycan/LPS O-acetylase OafA/YrhL